ncbi:hypothetical protein CEUSTIGMA_g12871.t1 [Chlamydomonas eustigma]|uniref:Uncharacterized protein n=1 Tax=Chlamydomonas eustigma TaxID=1157962 RepID=A0A250XQX1_9CHLO|nr:hypothetical protein CEUSTIGMA_g12871.t1 [Chlamydomonas eustigma]|eukprot:GAX85455.1 hypothetical protein CEUSTIGMA_g12871.t1 [Chlamydomonas eustigma]
MLMRLGTNLRTACASCPQLPRPQNVCSTMRARDRNLECSSRPQTFVFQAIREERRAHNVTCSALDDKKDSNGKAGATAIQFNPVYASICGAYALLMLFQNPYIFAALTILTIMPQNSSTTSLNSLVLIFYDSGLFMNFAEAVYCVRLVSWLSIACTLISFAIFA